MNNSVFYTKEELRMHSLIETLMEYKLVEKIRLCEHPDKKIFWVIYFYDFDIPMFIYPDEKLNKYLLIKKYKEYVLKRCNKKI